MSPQAPPTPRDLATTLAALPQAERTLLELLAVFGDTAPLSTIVQALGKVGHRIAGRAPRNDDARPLFQSLIGAGLLAGEGQFALPDALVHRALVTLARESRLERIATLVRELRPARSGRDDRIPTWNLALRELRLDLYAGRWDEARTLSREVPRYIFGDVCSPFDRAWIATLPADLRSHALAGIVETATATLRPAEEARAMLAVEPGVTDGEHRILVEALVFAGRLDDAELHLANRRSQESDVGRAFLAFLRGRTVEAIAAYEAALKAYLKLAGKRAVIFPDRAGLFFVVALLAEGSAASLARATDLAEAAKRAQSVPLAEGYAILSELLDVVAGRKEREELLHLTSTSNLPGRDPIELLLQAAASHWAKLTLPAPVRAELEQRIARAEAAGLRWYAAQGRDILAGGKRRGTAIDGVGLANVVAPRERWADTLAALLALAAPATAAKPKVPGGAADRRLAWIVRDATWGLSIEPREQTWTKGEWSKGKPVALKRLFEEGAHLGFLHAADRAVCARIATQTTYESYGRYPRVNYSLDAAGAVLALAGNDNVLVEVSDGRFEPCEIRKAAPRLEVARLGGRLALSLEPRPRRDDQTVSATVSGRSVEVVTFEPIHHAIAQALGKTPLDLPRSAEHELREVLRALSERVAVHAELPGLAGDADTVAGDSRACFLLRALGDGLSVAAHVRPLGREGPVARPGGGGATLFAQISGRPALATRNLAEESRRFERAVGACPVLSASRTADTEFVVGDRDGALEVLLELGALGTEVGLEWPDGEVLRVSDPVTIERLHVSISRADGSFVARVGLSIPGHEDLELAELCDYLSASPGRFLRLAGEERYVTLTAELRRHLDELLALGTRAGRQLRIPPLVAPLVADLLASSRVEADEAWHHQLVRLTASGADAEVPSTLRGALRPYQVEGFRWLVRLGTWGAGGCLADDMGLGKTLQAIALLLHRAPDGPGLVVAPTSVVSNWVDELQRFAPTLQVRTFLGPARANDLTHLGPFDLVVTSYSILQLDADALAKVAFSTAVLDEAQVIKNAETKRARAAGRLRADLRVATTGTPIENRLEDLHSIFAFLNPGLLGSPASFQTRFVRPIERDRDRAVRDRLQRLVAPFVLRRTKTQVLPELPPRTEVTLRLPLELEELALYEVVRKKALAGLTGGKRGGETKRFLLLAAITRLRQAASNARLVLPDSKAPSAKLAALGDLLDDLLPNHHKVLIFSQFVGHLALVRELLEARGVTFQYLDGSTPISARKLAVDSFQAGQGEVFLISLKAGGFGLNLTAADYVVHMDPWWNPAVEDQASDRAHRIGQSRPVTIYRLVARDTIEDRILALHHRKRELAAGILEGSELAASMSEQELLELIRGE